MPDIVVKANKGTLPWVEPRPAPKQVEGRGQHREGVGKEAATGRVVGKGVVQVERVEAGCCRVAGVDQPRRLSLWGYYRMQPCHNRNMYTQHAHHALALIKLQQPPIHSQSYRADSPPPLAAALHDGRQGRDQRRQVVIQHVALLHAALQVKR